MLTMLSGSNFTIIVWYDRNFNFVYVEYRNRIVSTHTAILKHAIIIGVSKYILGWFDSSVFFGNSAKIIFWKFGDANYKYVPLNVSKSCYEQEYYFVPQTIM